MSQIEPIPLHSIEAERAALGSCLFGEMAVDEVLRTTEMDHYFLNAHQLIYRAVKVLNTRNTPVDLVTLKRFIIQHDALELVGGEEYLIAIAESVPSPANAFHYARIVKENWVLREIERRCIALWKSLRDGSDTEEKLLAATQLADGLSLAVPDGSIASVDVTEDATGISTGIEALDGLIESRGWPDGQMAVIQADTNVGKSVFGIQTTIACLEKGKRCCYATFADLDRKQIGKRMLRQLCGWSKRPDNLLLQEQYEAAYAKLYGDKSDEFCDVFDLEIYDATGMATGYDVESFLSWLYVEHKKRPFGEVVIDYAQELTTRDRQAVGMFQAQATIAQKVNRAARSLNIPVIVLSQVTMIDKESKTMYSRAWEQKAGIIIEIPKKQDTLLLKKNRFGVKDVEIAVRLDAERVRFEEI